MTTKCQNKSSKGVADRPAVVRFAMNGWPPVDGYEEWSQKLAEDIQLDYKDEDRVPYFFSIYLSRSIRCPSCRKAEANELHYATCASCAVVIALECIDVHPDTFHQLTCGAPECEVFVAALLATRGDK